jgi:hypothetical protein
MEMKVSEIKDITMEKVWEELGNYFTKISDNISKER